MRISNRNNSPGVGCLLVFALPFAGVGVFMTGLTAATVFKSVRASEWERVPCRIESVDSRAGSEGDSSETKATYTYEFGGETYTGKRVSVHKGGDNIGRFQRRVYDELKRHQKDGKPFTARVNPDNPKEAVLYPRLRWEMLVMYMVFGLVFGGVGFGLMIGGVWAGKKVKREEARKQEAPAEPWRWKEEWATGEIKSSNKAGVIGILIFTILWNLVAIPAGIFVVMDEVVGNGNKSALFVLIFPGVGLLLILWAIRSLVQWRKFGTSVLKMASVPGVIGGKLAGVITAPVHITPEDGFHLSLQCVRRTETGSGKNRRTSESVLWEDERTMSRALLPNAPTRSAVPVLLALPYDAKQTDESSSSHQIVWRLEATAKVPGVDYAAKFEVPVFRTPESSPDFALDESSIQPFAAERNPAEEVRQAEVVVTKRGAGTTEFYFPPARALGSALGLTVFAVIWTGVIAFMVMKEAPLIFPIVFGFFDALIIMLVFDLWLGATRVTISNDSLRVRGGPFALGKEQFIDTGQIEDIKPNSSMQSGNTVFYNIQLHRLDGKKVALGKYILGRRRTESVIEAMKEALTA